LKKNIGKIYSPSGKFAEQAKLPVDLHKYGGKTKFGAKIKNILKHSIAQRGIFLQLTAKLSNNII